MNRLNLVNKKVVHVFVLLFIVAVIFTFFPVSVTKLHHMHAFSYLTMIMLWAFTIRMRITDKFIRDRIQIACFFMVMLFFLRMCKYSFFPGMPMVDTYVWYAYSIPLTFIPLFFFLSALRVEPIKNLKLIERLEKILIALNIIISLVIMTNEMHSTVYKITVHPDKEYTHEWFYYVVLVWRIGLAIGLLIVLARKCSITATKRKWYIPAICILTGCTLLIWYLINGGAPKIAGHKLFQLQEALCIPYIVGIESIIQIGMIPANTGYGKLFSLLSVNAGIYNNKAEQIATSSDWKQIKEDEDHTICKEPISGGYVTWIRDTSAINELNRSLIDVRESLKDENELIKHENKIRAERIGLETRNRLYNRIAKAVRTRAIRVDELLSKIETKNEDENSTDIIYAMVLSAYIKRMGNLILISDEKKTVSSGELFLAVRESLEYLKLRGCICQAEQDRSMELPSRLALLAYELFEEVIEDIWLRANTISVAIICNNDLEMTIATDEPAEAISSTWKDKEIRMTGGSLSVRYEDDTYYIRLRYSEKNTDLEEVVS